MIEEQIVPFSATAVTKETTTSQQLVYTLKNNEGAIRDYLRDSTFLANNWKAWWTVLTTVIFHAFALWAYFGIHSSCLFVLTYSLGLLRWFIIYHDCIHLSFWESKARCIYFGHFISSLTLTPYNYWRGIHSLHHDTSGDLTSAKHGFNDTILFTVREYLQLPSWKRYLYRVARDPIIFFTIIPTVHFFIEHRFRKGAFVTNVGVSLHCYLLYYFGGAKLSMLVIMAMILASSGGFALFHMQHTYNPTYVNNAKKQYSKFDASLQGSSLLVIPPILKWFTLGVEFHHIHHLTTRIPGYNLERVHKGAPPHLWNGIYVFDSFRKVIDSLSKTLWDEGQHRFVGFSDVIHTH